MLNTLLRDRHPTAFRLSTSTTASWKAAATSANRDRLTLALAELDPAGHRRLQPGEREVEPVPVEVSLTGQPAREVDGLRITVDCQPVDVRASREGQPEQSTDLVEGFAGSVVDRGTERCDV